MKFWNSTLCMSFTLRSALPQHSLRRAHFQLTATIDRRSLTRNGRTHSPWRKYFRTCEFLNVFVLGYRLFLYTQSIASKENTTNMPATSKTPQNTPSSNAPITSRAQAPGLSSLREGMLAPSSLAASNPTNIFPKRISTEPQPLRSSHRTPNSFR